MNKKILIVVLLLLLCAVIAVVPLLVINSEFGGADGAAEDVIGQIDPDYEPWAESLIEPPGGETESLLFCIQAAAGSGVFFYCFGVLRERRRHQKESDS